MNSLYDRLKSKETPPRPMAKCELCTHVRLLIQPNGPEMNRWLCRRTLGTYPVDGTGCQSFEREPGAEG